LTLEARRRGKAVWEQGLRKGSSLVKGGHAAGHEKKAFSSL
jgi:hypothetical protein